jgi:hypothetical protein
MANFTREYERVTCPGCQRTISAYIPHFGDGSGLRVVKHNISERRRHPWPVCEYSERIIVRDNGKWRLEF